MIEDELTFDDVLIEICNQEEWKTKDELYEKIQKVKLKDYNNRSPLFISRVMDFKNSWLNMKGALRTTINSLFPEENKFFNENNKIPIELPGNDLLISDFADELVKEIRNKDKLFFREDMRKVVEVTNLGFDIVQANRFITLVEKYFKPWTTVYTMKGQKEVLRSMPQIISNVVLASPNFQDNIKTIKRIFPVPIPIIHNEELTFPKKGYDERFLSYTKENSPTINPNISIEESKKVFYEIFKEFCFQNKQDYINAIAGLITPFLRGLFSNFNVRTPMFCYMANRERAGKDYCAGITGLLLEGFSLEEPPISSGEYKSSGTNDELRKKIVSALISGKKRLHFANNKGKLNNAVLEGFLTSDVFSDRILGKNESPNFDNEIDISLSGNIGMTFTADLANRARFINLFLDIEDANQREFKNPNLHNWVLKNRSYIISCIYSLIKNWFSGGCPKGSIPFASFPEWAEICGGIMEYAGIGNPCVKDEKISQGISLDEETDEMKSFFESMFEFKPDIWINKKEIKDFIKISNDNLFPYIDWENKAHQTKFGLKLDKYVGRVLSNIRLVVEDTTVRAARRKYKLTKEEQNFDKKEIFGDYLEEKGGNVVTGGNGYPSKESLKEVQSIGTCYQSCQGCQICGKNTSNKINNLFICEKCAETIPDELKTSSFPVEK